MEMEIGSGSPFSKGRMLMRRLLFIFLTGVILIACGCANPGPVSDEGMIYRVFDKISKDVNNKGYDLIEYIIIYQILYPEAASF
jgi:hypothetical protein